MARDGCRVAVIGAGFSGVMTAIHLLWRCNPGERVYLVERGDRVGPGLAYGTHNPRHLVNVRAENMSAFADEPEHFVQWLDALPPERRGEAGERTIAGTFVRRSVFGAYVQELLREAITRQDGADNLYLVTDEATAIRRANGGYLLETGNGRTYPIDAAVLALGNLPEAREPLPGYVDNPWSPAATAPLEPGRPVVVLGTGLTMVDIVPRPDRAGVRGADSCHLAPRPAAARSCSIGALGAAQARRGRSSEPARPCSGRCAARCVAPVRTPSAGER